MKAEFTGGCIPDYKGYDPVLRGGPDPKVPLADRGYAAICIRSDVEARSGAPVIPMRKIR